MAMTKSGFQALKMGKQYTSHPYFVFFFIFYSALSYPFLAKSGETWAKSSKTTLCGIVKNLIIYFAETCGYSDHH